ncbi:transferase family-domain-containing protein [Lasiosphaeria ovina]|uniref:Transferase family-domain-containing protein n=1 Tax=Lasiosphaeria ovina TaxID=92902 RepID=A0AAE0NAH2_9PEZI|nr:transferase family-domain-containing protein [Lasiosphaeria ovina]
MGSVQVEEDYGNLDRYQDVLGQLPMLQVYSHVLYFFAMPEGVTAQDVVHDLEIAVTKVRRQVPWMGARIVSEGKGPGNSGLYRPVACAPPQPAIDVKFIPDDANHPSYAELRTRKAPQSMIHTELLTPVPAFPQKFEDSDESPAHVVRVQASFIRGGVIVDFAIAHNIADAGGHFGLVKLVAAAMRGEPFAPELLALANHDRRGLPQLLGPDEPLLDHSRHKRASVPLANPSPSPSPEPARYHVFRFSPQSMARLKALASQHEPTSPSDTAPPAPAFISTDDALCAFIWKHLISVRQSRHAPTTRSRFGRQMDGRRLVGLGPDYMGEMAHNAECVLTFGELATLSVGAIAGRLRAALNAANTLYHLRSFATFVAREEDKSAITYAGEFRGETDVGCSSIRALRGVFPGFGRLGTPEFVRRPPSVPFASTVVLFPGSEAGDCDAVACLTDRDFEVLRGDGEWNGFVEYIG